MLRRAWAAIVQTGFHFLYTLFAPGYDLVAWSVSKGDWQAWGRASLSHLKPGRVLELGSGPGHLLSDLADVAPLAVGVEVSAAMVTLAQPRRGRAALVRARAQALPFRDHAFTTVVSVFPAPYIAAPASLDNIERVLAQEGRLVIVDAAELTGHDPWVWGVNLAYAVTSRPLAHTPLPSRLARRGFYLTQHSHPSRHGRVSVLVAEKMAREAA